jgi:hypothetical protein
MNDQTNVPMYAFSSRASRALDFLRKGSSHASLGNRVAVAKRMRRVWPRDAAVQGDRDVFDVELAPLWIAAVLSCRERTLSVIGEDVAEFSKSGEALGALFGEIADALEGRSTLGDDRRDLAVEILEYMAQATLVEARRGWR